ncbi:MAG: ComEA family DNA-binding protein, partial [Pseudonocardiales bacterium]
AEQARVARRVRAILVDAADADGAADGATRPQRVDVLPWLPGHDLADAPAAVRPAVASPTASRGTEPADRHGGWLSGLTARLPIRVDPGWRGALGIGVAVLVAALVTGGWVLSARPHSVGVSDTTGNPATVTSAGASATGSSLRPAAPRVPVTSAPAMLVVDVTGKVRHPGLYRLPAGSRVDDAVQAAGGVLPIVDLSTVNLAAHLTDGQQIAVGIPGAPPAPGGPASTGTSASVPVDLNTATVDQLETLPGVGPVLAQHILDWRVAHGRFATIDQLRDVSGIGEVKFAALRARVSV